MTKRQKETLGGCRCTCYLDCLDMFLILIVMMASQSIYMSKIIQLYAINMCNLLYANYTSIKLLEILEWFNNNQ